MTVPPSIALAGRAAGAFYAFKYGRQYVPGVHPIALALAGWLAAGIIIDNALPRG